MLYTQFTKALFSFIIHPLSQYVQFLKKNGRLFWADFHEASKYTTLCAHVIYRIKPKSEDNCGIYTYIFFLRHYGPTRAMTSLFLGFLDHAQRRITVGRTSVDE